MWREEEEMWLNWTNWCLLLNYTGRKSVLLYFVNTTETCMESVISVTFRRILVISSCVNTGRTRKFLPPPWYKGQGVNGTCPFRFWYVAVFQWKSFDLLNKVRYILWVVGLPEAFDVTNNGPHLGRHVGFYQELKIRWKPHEMVRFCVWHLKYDINKHFVPFYPQFLLLLLKEVAFSFKNGLTACYLWRHIS